ncbi:hypothetical protein CRENBAI_026287 [Crenichthys baileyi]|uniref:Uncharacterized protein n=1 Tax=Crenichthys baileyi TaxID=28760 RepID=A0AAV9RHK9_9TELE
MEERQKGQFMKESQKPCLPFATSHVGENMWRMVPGHIRPKPNFLALCPKCNNAQGEKCSMLKHRGDSIRFGGCWEKLEIGAEVHLSAGQTTQNRERARWNGLDQILIMY